MSSVHRQIHHTIKRPTRPTERFLHEIAPLDNILPRFSEPCRNGYPHQLAVKTGSRKSTAGLTGVRELKCLAPRGQQCMGYHYATAEFPSDVATQLWHAYKAFSKKYNEVKGQHATSDDDAYRLAKEAGLSVMNNSPSTAPATSQPSSSQTSYATASTQSSQASSSSQTPAYRATTTSENIVFYLYPLGSKDFVIHEVPAVGNPCCIVLDNYPDVHDIIAATNSDDEDSRQFRLWDPKRRSLTLTSPSQEIRALSDIPVYVLTHVNLDCYAEDFDLGKEVHDMFPFLQASLAPVPSTSMPVDRPRTPPFHRAPSLDSLVSPQTLWKNGSTKDKGKRKRSPSPVGSDSEVEIEVIHKPAAKKTKF